MTDTRYIVSIINKRGREIASLRADDVDYIKTWSRQYDHSYTLSIVDTVLLDEICFTVKDYLN